MRANSHKATAAAYCLPGDNKVGRGSSSDHSHTALGYSIHQSTLQRKNFRRRRRRGSRRVRHLNLTSRLVVWTLIVISMPHYCTTQPTIASAAQANSPQSANPTVVSNATEQREEVRRTEARRDDDSDVISASEIITNPFQPPARRRTNTNSSDQAATSGAPPTPPPLVSVGTEDKLAPVADTTRREDGQQFDIVSAAADEASLPPPSSHDDATLNQQQQQETVSQQTSRLLLQLLVLGLFILVSSALIIVYSIKFCVCQRRKERRLLRRALVGDISAHSGNDLHQTTAAYQQQQQQQQLLLSLRHPSQLAQLDPQHLLDDDLHSSYNHLLTSSDYACLQPTTMSPSCPHEEHQLQVISCLVGGAHGQNQAQLTPSPPSSDPDVLHYFPSSANCQQPVSPPVQQSQLILALLNRLQQLLTLASREQPASSTAPLGGSPQQLSQLIVAQLQAQFGGYSPLLVGQASHQAACLCPHGAASLRTLSASPQRQPASRPPAYSELFSTIATAASGNDGRTVQVGAEESSRVGQAQQRREQEEGNDDDDDVHGSHRRSARGRSRAHRAQSLQPPLAPIGQ